ncbi:MAG: hypothetical protein H0W50_05765 [Parachlamydiaceae bacterium]|nr:hypothetical protein [Parachlamydiaceae bacterium]
MLDEFEEYFGNVDVKELKAFISDAKEESVDLKAQGEGDKEIEEVVKFMTVLLENIEEEIQGLTTLKTLDLKKKVRLYAMIHLFHELCGAVGDDEEFDDEFDDEDFDEDEDEDEINGEFEEDEEIEGDDAPNSKKL